jgi:hypothetical protein
MPFLGSYFIEMVLTLCAKIELGHRKGIKKHRKNISLKNSQNWQKDLGCRLCDKLSQSSAFQ